LHLIEPTGVYAIIFQRSHGGRFSRGKKGVFGQGEKRNEKDEATDANDDANPHRPIWTIRKASIGVHLEPRDDHFCFPTENKWAIC
jgi:hypothetical protein